MRDRIIFHIDVNSAFLSWSAVKKLQEEPGSLDLRTIPSVVGGDPKSRHGIVTARSLPAKKYGIRTAETIASAMQKCPDLVVIPSDFDTYRKYSRAFMEILRTYTDLVEQASIDEAYLDVTGLCQGFTAPSPKGAVPECEPSGPGRIPAGSAPVKGACSLPEARWKPRQAEDRKSRYTALELAAQIRKRIREELGFTVNVGISTNRLLAKMASDFEKPDRTHTLFPEEVPEKMWPLPIGDLYGCGRRTSARLRTLGIQTIGDAAHTPAEILIDNLGDKSGKYIHSAANGAGRAAVSPVREEAKSYSNEWTTSSDITLETYEAEFLPLLQHLCDKVAGRLQRDHVYARTVVVTVKTDDFRRRSAQRQMSDASNQAAEIFRTAAALSDRLLLGERGLFADGTGIRLVGAGVTDLDDGAFRQMSLLDWEPEEVPEELPGTEPFKEAEAAQEAELIKEAEAAQEPELIKEAEAAQEPEPIDKAKANQEPEPERTGPKAEKAGREETAAPPDVLTRKNRDARLQEMEKAIRRRYGEDAVRRGV